MAFLFNRRLFQNCLMTTVVIMSLASFFIFTFYSSTDSVHHPNMPRHVDLDAQKDGPQSLLNKFRETIPKVEEKIKANQQNRSSVSIKPLEHSSVNAFSQNGSNITSLSFPTPNYNVHIFYYPWYKNEKVDGQYAHWNHELIPHWNDKSRTRKRQHVPPDDIGANFYPKLGPYSSADPQTIDAHMKHIRMSGAGVLAVSWYPPHYEQTSETPVDDLMMMLFDAAAKYSLKIAFHIEPYINRSGETLREVVKFVFNKYGNHSAFYRTEMLGRKLPVFYVYDSYQIKPTLWADALSIDGKYSIRNTELDAIFLGLLVEQQHFDHLSESGFDGFYTYFASNGFVYGSTWRNWPEIAAESKNRKLIFVPSIGPGYLDTRVRPWNGKNTKLRLNGRYYRSAFQSALAVKPQFLTVTSFNEWHEGTQVEPAVPKSISDFRYEDYRPNTPEFYLNLTRNFAEEYRRNMTQVIQSHEHSDTF